MSNKTNQLTIWHADTNGNKQNCFYQQEVHVTDRETLRHALGYDHVFVKFRDNKRGNENFLYADFLVLDCDNLSANPRGAVGSETNDSTTPPGNMSPSAVSEISLVSMDINGLDSSVKNATYTGKALEPAVTVKDGDIDVPVTADYSNNTKAGKGTVKITAKEDSAYYGTVTKTFTIAKAAQKITKVTPAAKTFKAKKKTKKLGKNYSFTLKAAGTGPVKATFAKANKVGASKIAVAKTGKVTVKKGLKKGTYKVKVKASKAANANYKAAAKTVTIKK